ncbi:MAG: type II toxin-antitoxin system RelE/ParE family toxin [Clostridium sp.]|nr:type II toxin-antitoxin system RelE/ParE family toxin [Clostridium sp.]MCM1173324.1 type II toxin-antitoxin system RelE/ParE family toxin [Clostridium sp.]MCM1208914.1 type II toxin-antitoxin system RelE/ParE family toxin [Ruminococcus sp.]
MNRTFIEVPIFTKKWKALGLTDEILRDLQNILLNDPKAGEVIQGTGGLRKIRIPMENRGKSGGGRVIYVDIELKEIIYFVNVYSKNEKDDLTEDEKKAFKAVVKILKEG